MPGSERVEKTKAMLRASAWAASALLCLVMTSGAARAQWSTPDTSGNINNTNTGNVGVGTSSPAVGLHIATQSTATPRGVIIQQSNTGNNGAFLVFRKSRGTIASPSAIANGDPLGSVYSEAFDGSSFLRTGAMIKFVSNGAVAVGSVPTDITFATGSSGTGTEQMRLTSYGYFGVGTSTPANQFHVNNAWGAGAIRVSGAGLGVVNFMDLNAGANQKLYQWRSEGGLFRMALVNDAENGMVQQNLLVANSAGNVGVGTGTPVARLDVRQVSNSGTYGTLLLSYGANEDTYLRGGTSAAAIHIGDLTATAARLLLMENGGSVGVGTASPAAGYRLDVAGGMKVTNTAGATDGNLTVDGTITGGNIQAKYQDVAEWVPSTQKLSAGTVVVLDAGRTNHVLASSSPYDTKVAGVVSGAPGVILGTEGEGKLKVATTGRVRVKVDATRGAIHVGDLLVTSGVEGVAMKSVPVDLGGTQIHRPGTIIGKALEPLERGTGEILVLLSLQ